eukprot:GILJ01001690.1.p1 GENE.GILJ01001690.1~~GILJ01001690.1.p1  ORF type:complete len:291 (-),score=39.83 GILJ01001690.1:173-1006(-)
MDIAVSSVHVDVAVPVKPKWPGHENLSRVLQNAEHWYEIGLLYPHEAIRQDLKTFTQIFSRDNVSGSLSDAWKVQRFLQYFSKYFYPMVHGHHDVEEKIYVPWVKSRVAVPDKVCMDHKHLLDELDNIKSFEPTINVAVLAHDETAYHTDFEKLREAVLGLNGFMCDHLAEEEVIFPPLLKEHFTEAEEQQVIQRIVKAERSLGPIMLPWILSAMAKWGGPERVAAFFKTLPAPVRYLLRSRWQPSFEQNAHGLLHSALGHSADEWTAHDTTCCTVQ